MKNTKAGADLWPLTCLRGAVLLRLRRFLLWQTKGVCHTELTLDSQTAGLADILALMVRQINGWEFPFLCAGAIFYWPFRIGSSRSPSGPGRDGVEARFKSRPLCSPRRRMKCGWNGGPSQVQYVRYRASLRVSSCSSWLKTNAANVDRLGSWTLPVAWSATAKKGSAPAGADPVTNTFRRCDDACSMIWILTVWPAW